MARVAHRRAWLPRVSRHPRPVHRLTTCRTLRGSGGHPLLVTPRRVRSCGHIPPHWARRLFALPPDRDSPGSMHSCFPVAHTRQALSTVRCRVVSAGLPLCSMWPSRVLQNRPTYSKRPLGHLHFLPHCSFMLAPCVAYSLARAATGRRGSRAGEAVGYRIRWHVLE